MATQPFSLRLGASLILAATIVCELGLSVTSPGPSDAASLLRRPAYVGSDACAVCHQAEAKLWDESQHRHAMDHATEKSVLGNFNNASFDYHGTRSRFFRKDGNFYVDTDGTDGSLSTFQVKYTFGVYPLQQYLVEFPDGRIQALSIAWDSRPKQQGGQRWFHLYPKENIRHGDPLHWTKLNQNWNHMCAECHSTNVHKNYNPTNDRFATTWSEISVGCEACHGPGSRHLEWAQAGRGGGPPNSDASKGLVVLFDERRGPTWVFSGQTGAPERGKAPALLRKEVETCGRCHARRSEFSENWVPGWWLSETHEVSLLDPTTFAGDGQMRDNEESYNYAAFKQSKMFAKGVTCSDCHDPHSARLRVSGTRVCVQCHIATKYEATAHSHHKPNSSVTCVSCHMPVRSYMIVDRRHDHSFRIPRPDLSVTLGTPNACTDCHRDKPAQWAEATIAQWFGPKREGFQNYAAAFETAWNDIPGAERLLADVASNPANPTFVRASAFNDLNAYVSQIDVSLVRLGLSDPDPMVRIGALDMLTGVPARPLWALISPLLSDPVRGVRIKAVSLLASIPEAEQPPRDRPRFEQAASELIAAQNLSADRPEARTSLGNFFAQRGQFGQAEAEFIAALRISPRFAPAAINLADVYRAAGKDRQGVDVLRKAAKASPADAGIHYALGLALVRTHDSGGAIQELRRATSLAPGQPDYAYVLAVGLRSVGRVTDAIEVLKKVLLHHPTNRDALVALVMFHQEIHDYVGARKYAERLVQAFPTDQQAARMLRDLK